MRFANSDSQSGFFLQYFTYFMFTYYMKRVITISINTAKRIRQMEKISMSQSKLITTENVPAALDRAINALTGLRATYTEERTDTGSNETGDVAYLNAAHDCALITRQLQHDMLQAAADRVGEPVETFDISCVMEMEGVDTDILGELREMLDERFHQIGCREYNTKPKSQPFPISETSPTSHLLVRNGRLV